MKEIFSSKLVLVLIVLMILSWLTLGIVYFTDFWLDWLPPQKTTSLRISPTPEAPLKLLEEKDLYATLPFLRLQPDKDSDEFILTGILLRVNNREFIVLDPDSPYPIMFQSPQIVELVKDYQVGLRVEIRFQKRGSQLIPVRISKVI